MSNPLKPQIAPPQVEPSRSSPVRIASIDVSSRRSKSGPLKMGPELMAIFEGTVKSFEVNKAAAIKSGELDRNGNPLGTKYWDDGVTIKRNRRETGPRKKVIIKTNMSFGELTIVDKAKKLKNAARPNLAERYKCQCSCGKVVVVPKYYLLRKPNPKTHCGHMVQTPKSLNPREYRIYMMIHQRCFNKNHVSYEHYKSRGITLYEPWNNIHKDGFEKFLAEVGKSPTQWHSLDRVHNSRGYEPGNLRWATSAEQRANQGDRIGGYTSEQIADMGLTEEEFIEKIISGEIQ